MPKLESVRVERVVEAPDARRNVALDGDRRGGFEAVVRADDAHRRRRACRRADVDHQLRVRAQRTIAGREAKQVATRPGEALSRRKRG
jgi:hypothetical protein